MAAPGTYEERVTRLWRSRAYRFSVVWVPLGGGGAVVLILLGLLSGLGVVPRGWLGPIGVTGIVWAFVYVLVGIPVFVIVNVTMWRLGLWKIEPGHHGKLGMFLGDLTSLLKSGRFPPEPRLRPARHPHMHPETRPGGLEALRHGRAYRTMVFVYLPFALTILAIAILIGFRLSARIPTPVAVALYVLLTAEAVVYFAALFILWRGARRLGLASDRLFWRDVMNEMYRDLGSLISRGRLT